MCVYECANIYMGFFKKKKSIPACVHLKLGYKPGNSSIVPEALVI